MNSILHKTQSDNIIKLCIDVQKGLGLGFWERVYIAYLKVGYVINFGRIPLQFKRLAATNQAN
jgi:hypothetical protein